ncbi:MAG: site-2 protease family protein [Actinomycetia bacterium]|nr:site-2 protease family protein [Actinomycetes bacterium]
MDGTAAGDGLRVGRFLGIPIFAHPSLFLTAGLLAFAFVPLVEDFDPAVGSSKYLLAAGFAALLYLSILVHELAHAAVARRFGLPVRSITLYMLGGVTALERPAGTPGREFAVSAAGPAATLVLAGLGWLGLAVTGPGSLAQLLLFQVTMANLVVGVYNLLPGLPLDGGSMLAALVWRVTGRELTGTVVAGWAGRLVAVATVALPLLVPWAADRAPDPFLVVWGAVIGFFLWSGSTQALRSARVRARLPRLTVLGLVRPALPVAVDVPLAEALRRLGESDARALVVTGSDGRPTGLVSEAAVTATPPGRRPWVSVGDVSRRLEPELVVRSDLVGEGLLTALRRSPATEYLVVEPDGAVRGVLSTADVEAALSRG